MVEETKVNEQPQAPVSEPVAPEQLNAVPVAETVAPVETLTEPTAPEALKATEEVAQKVEEKKESLSAELKETKEELGVIKEVREELVALYARNKDIETHKEQLAKDLASVTSELKTTKEQLQRYLNAEVELNAKKKAERLQKLVENFKILGQEKTVEQLSAKDDQTIVEFETIVEAALQKAQVAESAMPSVVSPSQAIPQKAIVPSVKASEALSKKLPKKESDSDFYKRLCGDLRGEQLGNYSNKRIKAF